MPLYWFFDAQSVARRCQFLPYLRQSGNFREALAALAEARERVSERKERRFTL